MTFWFLNVQRPEGGGGHQFIFVALSKLFVCNKLSIVFGCGKSIRCPKKLLSSYECCSIVSFTKQWKNFVDFIIHSQLYNIFHLTTIEWKQERKRKKYFPKQRKYTRSDLKISFRHMSFERMSHQELLEEMNEIEEERLKESPTSCCFSEKCALFLSWPRTNQSWRATFWTGPSSATRGGRCALELHYLWFIFDGVTGAALCWTWDFANNPSWRPLPPTWRCPISPWELELDMARVLCTRRTKWPFRSVRYWESFHS